MLRKKLPLVLILAGAVMVMSSAGLYFFSGGQQRAFLTVESVPESNVYVNEKLVGRTPFSGEFPTSTINLKLIPLAFDSPRVSFETSVDLVSGVNTVVRRDQGEDEASSSGEILSFQKTPGEANVIVIANTNSAEVSLEDNGSGKVPYKFSQVTPKTLNLTISAPEHETRSFLITPQAGYTLTVLTDLKK